MSTEFAKNLRTTFAVRGIFALWLAATVIGTIYPDLRVWGLHLPAFLPLWLQVVFFGLGLLLIILPERFFSLRRSHVIPRILQSPLPAILLAAGYVIFRAWPALLGDGRLRGREVQLGMTHPFEFLPGWLSCRIHELGRPLLGHDGWGAVAIVSTVAGLLFLFFLWYFPRRIWENPRDRLVARALPAVSAITVLFFGYVESYALPCALIVGLMLAAEAYRRDKGPFYIVVILLAAAVAAHLITIVLFPAVLALALARGGRRTGRLTVMGILSVLTVVWLYLVFFISNYASDVNAGSVLVSFWPAPPANYGLISPAHFLDLGNLVFLVCPGVLVAMPLVFFHRGNEAQVGRTFWVLAVFGLICMPILLDPKLGMARDWDLFGLGLVPLIVWIAVRLADTDAKLPPSVLVRVLFAQFAVFAMFAGINSHPPAAVARFEKLLMLDQNRGGYGHEVLAIWYRDSGRTDQEILHWQKAAYLEENKRYWGGLAQAHLRGNNFRFALQAAQRAYVMDTSWVRGVSYVAAAYRELRQPDSALMFYRRAIDLDPQADVVRHDLATLFMGLGRFDEALGQIDTAIALAPDSAVYLGVRGWILLEADRPDEGEYFLREALRMEPDQLSARINLSRVLQKTGRPDSALIELIRVLQRPGLPPELRDYLERLGESIRQNAFTTDSTG